MTQPSIDGRIQAFHREVPNYTGELEDLYPMVWFSDAKKSLRKHLEGEPPHLYYELIVSKFPAQLVEKLEQLNSKTLEEVGNTMDIHFSRTHWFNKIRGLIESHDLFVGLTSKQAKYRAYNAFFRCAESTVTVNQIMKHLVATFYYRFEDASANIPNVLRPRIGTFTLRVEEFFKCLEKAETQIRNRNQVRELAELLRKRRIDGDPQAASLITRRYAPIREIEELEMKLQAKEAKLA